jgi:hypothetical protein
VRLGQSATYAAIEYSMQAPDPKAKLRHLLSALHLEEQEARFAVVPDPS